MSEPRFTLHPIRTSKQGVQINVGKHQDEHETHVSLATMHPDDMKELNLPPKGGSIRVRSADGDPVVFQCQEGKVPRGMIFVPYGPPTCKLMAGDTDGTGMPTSKGMEVEVEAIPSGDK